MTPSLIITIEIVEGPEGPDGPARVIVKTDAAKPGEVADDVGRTWFGLCCALNGYMHARGAPGFDVLKPYRLH
jgi:hypothetical protein